MYKIINILLFIGLLNTSIFAETTKEDVDKYLEISRGKTIIKYSFLLRYEECFSIMYGKDIKKADKRAIKKYKAFIFNSKYEDIFYKAFSQLDDTSYYEIMAFYNTKLGKKYAQAFQEVYEMDISKELTTLIREKKDNIVLSKKRKLVTEINKALYSRYYTNIEKNIFLKSHGGIKVENYTGSTKRIPQNILDEYFEVFSEIAYRDFSDEELLQVLQYAKTYGKIEMGILHHALKLNIDAFKKDLKEFINKKTASK